MAHLVPTRIFISAFDKSLMAPAPSIALAGRRRPGSPSFYAKFMVIYATFTDNKRNFAYDGFHR